MCVICWEVGSDERDMERFIKRGDGIYRFFVIKFKNSIDFFWKLGVN